ncbi:MAG: hypothetical protein ABSH23_10085 [Steroidobacteraceae bacterium]|jgi:hypothetical protein
MDALQRKFEPEAGVYVERPIDLPALAAVAPPEHAAATRTERRGPRRRMSALRLTRPSEDMFHQFRIY